MKNDRKQQFSIINSQFSIDKDGGGMELKPGYKQTEVGVIPEDWDAVPIGRFCICFSGGTPSTSNPRYYGGNIPWITSSDLNKRRITEVAGRITEEGLANSAAKLVDEGTLLIALYGATAGVCAISEIHSAINQAVLAVITRNAATEFLFQFLTLRKAHYIKTYTQGGQPNFSGAIVKAFVVALPPLPEQRAIATALSDVDALLDGLDRLITKKRDLKQAAMQQLLTGETRLPGFEGEWEVKRLGELATFHKGKGLPKSALNPYSTEPCIHYGELFTQYGESIIETISRTHRMPDEFRSVANDVLMPTSDVTPRGLAKASCVLIDGVVLGGDILVIRTNPSEVSGTFLSYVIRREDDQVLRLVTGTTVFHLYGTDMKKFTFKLPPISEQQAIVTVLSDMDAEITALERHRNKTKDIKQAMMQELLTGKTRLIDPLGATR